jgi:hypothetical protein
MRKPFFAVTLILALALLAGAQQNPAQQPKPEDVLKNLVTVESPLPAPDVLKPGFESITAKDVITLLTYLSSDLMEGRETGTRGHELAAAYAASLLSLWKIKPLGDQPQPQFFGRFGPSAPGAQAPAPERSYLQGLVLKEISDASASMTLETRNGEALKTRTFQAGIDYSSLSSTPETISAPVVFAGYGISEKSVGYDDFKGLDVKGKIVMILTEAPGKDDPKSPFQASKELKDKYFPAGGPMRMMMRYGQGFNKVREIADRGPAAILQVQNKGNDADIYRMLGDPRRPSDDRPIIDRPRRRLLVPGTAGSMPWERSSVITITREMADAILEGSGAKLDDLQKKIETTYKPASLVVPGTRLTLTTTAKTSLVKSMNVLGMIEGSDPVLKDEFVMVGAHLDHLGAFGDYVFNGADDNGSGSVGVLSIARAMALSPRRPKRSVVFALWTGEEEGLLGSRFYVMNPALPLDKTVAYFNLDMISRPYDEKTLQRMSFMMNIPTTQDILKKIKPENFVPVNFVAGAGLGEILRAADQYVGLDLFLREAQGQEGRGMGGSDHASFASVKVPWLFAMAAMTEDYHQTSDSVEKVSGNLIEKISRLTFSSLYALADK